MAEASARLTVQIADAQQVKNGGKAKTRCLASWKEVTGGGGRLVWPRLPLHTVVCVRVRISTGKQNVETSRHPPGSPRATLAGVIWKCTDKLCHLLMLPLCTPVEGYRACLLFHPETNAFRVRRLYV